ncbi:MAG: MupG family TIM beta-alpha barrel fold protein [Tissierellia bacterium]|nr:MupG family TIM beta-alpha barrel fold protein [Tissierellia bacterium]
MIGFSVNLNDDPKKVCEYIEKMKDAGFSSVFTTIFVPEDDKSSYLEALEAIGGKCKELEMDLMLGTSEESIREVKLELSAENLRDLGITGLRVTPTTPLDMIANCTKHFTVAISASHTSSEDLRTLNDLGADFSNIEAWYYYYERKEIGLSRKYMEKNNLFWETMDIKTVAFAPGDDNLSEDFTGKVTLEIHRDKHPLYSTIDLLDDLGVDKVYIGDSPLTAKTINQFNNYMKDELLIFYVDVLDYEYFDLVKGKHRNRIDEAEYVIRAEDFVFKSDIHVVNRYLVSRSRGSLTLDNNKYGRYMGEFHINKVDMDLSKKVNVVAHIREEDIDLIDKCRGGMYFEILENAEEEQENSVLEI